MCLWTETIQIVVYRTKFCNSWLRNTRVTGVAISTNEFESNNSSQRTIVQNLFSIWQRENVAFVQKGYLYTSRKSSSLASLKI